MANEDIFKKIDKTQIPKEQLERELEIIAEMGDSYEDWMNNFLGLVLPNGYGYIREAIKNTKENELLTVLDRTIVEIDKDGSIKALIEELTTPPGDWLKRSRIEPELKKKLIPVFARLLALGYSRRELAR